MHYFKHFFLVIISLFVFAGPVRAEMVEPVVPVQERIENYDTLVQVDKDGELTVIEIIEYNFADAPDKHGIVRTIPFQYLSKEQTSFNVRIKIKSITDEVGQAYVFKQDRSSAGELILKIGDAQQVVRGRKMYVITYTVDRAISFFENQDEVYWNAIGIAWDVPIVRATARVVLPEAVPSGLNFVCYLGKKGSRDTCPGSTNDQKTIVFTAPRELSAHEGFTVVVGFPKGIVQPPSRMQSFWWFVADNWPLGIPFLVLLLMLFIRHRYGREPKGRGTIIAEFDAPDGLSAIEVGTIVDQKVDDRDISSIIIDLAIRKYLKIKEVKSGVWATDYEFTQLKNAEGLDRFFERMFLMGLFKEKEVVTLSELKNNFYTTAREVKNEVYTNLKKQGYFAANPDRVRSLFIIIALVLFFGVTYFFSIFSGGIAGRLVIASIVSALIVGIFGFLISVKTQKGMVAKEHIEGFKLFLSVTEKDRLKFHNAPEKKPELFEKYLPYAMALKVEKQWAGQFKDIFTQPPDWYSGNWTAFDVIAFSSQLSSFSATTVSSLTTSPSSSSGFSGGSSGGGFGGGGGGSW